MPGHRLVLAVLAEDAVDPTVTERRERGVLPAGGVGEPRRELLEVDALHLLASPDRIGLPGDVSLERFRLP